MLSLIPDVALLAADTPDPDDVVAGWSGFAVFIGLIIAVALLLWSFTRQLKKTDRAAERGVYGPVAGTDEADEAADVATDGAGGDRRDADG